MKTLGSYVRRTLAGSWLLAAASPLAAQSLAAQSRQLLFVENTRGGTVSVVDDATLKVVGTIDVGQSPDDIIPSPDGRMLYLSRMVRRSDGRPTGTGELVGIDPRAQRVLWRVPFRGVPNHLAVSPDGRLVYVTIISLGQVDVIDPARHAVVDSVAVGTGPHDISVSADGHHVYVGLIGGTEVVEFDAASHAILRRIDFGGNIRPIAVTDDEGRLFVQLSRNHGFVVADPRSGTILQRVAMPVPAGRTLPDSLPIDVNHGLRITADGKILIANGSIVDETALYALPDLTLLAAIPVGRDPNWITLSPDGRRCYVSNRGSNDVSVIDLATRKEVARVKVGDYPQRMAAVAVGP